LAEKRLGSSFFSLSWVFLLSEPGTWNAISWGRRYLRETEFKHCKERIKKHFKKKKNFLIAKQVFLSLL